MSTTEYIQELKERDIFVHIRGGELKIKAKKEALTEEILSGIKCRKEEMLAFYKTFNGEASDSSAAQIKPAPPQSHYPLSSSQRRMYFLQSYDPVSVVYNMPQVVKLAGALDRKHLEGVFSQLIGRHESLRTSFGVVEGEAVQVVHKQVDFALEYHQTEESAAPALIREFVRPFDLQQASQFRVGLVKLSEQAHLLLVDMHHIISDGVSQGQLIQDFMALYQGKALPGLDIQYKDYAVWQQSDEQQLRLKAQRQFWRDEFAHQVSVLDLPTDRSRPVALSHRGAYQSCLLDQEETNRLKALSQEAGATLYMTMLSVFNVLLSKLSRQEDITIGTPVAGRDHAEVEGVIGMFVNTVVLRNYPKGGMSFRQFLTEVKRKVLGCFAHQGYGYEELIEELGIPRDPSRNPLFDVMFSYEHQNKGELVLPGLRLQDYPSAHAVSKFDLTLTVSETEEGMYLNFEYAKDLFDQGTIVRFISYLQKIIAEVTADPQKLLVEIDILSEEERTQLLHEFNDTAAEYPKDKTLVELFEEQVEKNPDRTALIFGEQKLSYRAFHQRVDHLANVLISRGVQQGDIVGLMCDRSFEMMVGVYGIIKAGAAYLPIDPTYPQSRIAYIVKDSGANLIAASSEVKEKVPKSIDCLALDLLPDPQSFRGQKVTSRAEPEGLAYVIYTSGSTGNPKGVMIEHRSLMNRLHWMGTSYPIGADDVVLQKTPTTFDVSVWELFWWSQQGASLCLLTPGGEKDPHLLSNGIAQHQVSTVHFVPSMLRAFLDHVEEQRNLSALCSLNQVFSSGEALTMDQVNRFRRLLQATNQTSLINLYGPTEATIDVTYYNCDTVSSSCIPIGKPIFNTSMYVLDASNRLQPVGVPGELCIGGVGLARGYLNNKELTQKKFIAHPFKEGERMYRTGDLARWLPDGNIEFLGRIDHQVKIRGFRIELGEIEHQLNTHEAVQDTVVLVKERAGDPYLVGYYVSQTEVASTELRDHLFQRLPEYMVPAYFVHQEAFPLTTSGKVDRKALPDPVVRAGEDYVAPVSETEEALVALWGEVLSIDPADISTTASFFSLGGHSLKATTLVNKIAKQFGVALPLKEVFRYQDIKSLGAFILSQHQSAYEGISPAVEQDYYPLSSSQRRMYFLYEYDRSSLAYNMPQVVKLEGELDEAKLTGAFRQLVARHQSLRTSFVPIDEEVVQVVHDKVNFGLEHYEADEEQAEPIIQRFIRPFDLSTPCQLRAGLVRLSDQQHLLMVDMHHIISDGASQNLLIQDFMSLYRGEMPPALPLHYKDYAVWLQEEERQAARERHRKFWHAEFAQEVGVLDLPTDRPRPSQRSHQGQYQSRLMDEGKTAQLKELSQKAGATLYMTLLSVFNVLLNKLSGQQDITVGTPVSGRDHADVERIIGMFVNTVVLRNNLEETASFRQFLAQVKEKTLSCFEHQDYQYEELIEELGVARDTSRNPLFDVMFSYQHALQAELALPGLRLQSHQSTHQVSKFDLTLIASEAEGRLYVSMEYATDLFEDETIARFMGYFERIIEEVLRDADQPLNEIEVLSEEEKQQLLSEFNDTVVAYPRNKTVIDLFEEQVAGTPHNVAFWCGDRSATYQELHEQANQVAAYLRQQVGIRQGDRVGLLLEREEFLLPSLFGILKAGAAYVPLSTTHPAARNQAIVDDAELKALITRGHYAAGLETNVETKLVNLDVVREEIHQQSAAPRTTGPKGDDLAYVIYTSGSTGRPKGVMIEHHSVVNRLLWMQKAYPITPEDVLLQKTPLVFDVSVWELFWWSLTGASVCLLPPEDEKDPKQVIEAIGQYQVSVVHFVPSMLIPFLHRVAHQQPTPLSSLRQVFCSGEALGAEQVAAFGEALNKTYSTQLINLYGPTEATVDVSHYPCDFTQVPPSIPIGKPIDNVKLYVLNKSNGLCPIGVPGELCIAGAGLARGYIGADPLTKEKFVAHPHQPGERMYRTGDLACWLPDGNIKFLGRIDHQVKIRGFRIELGEIESQLSAYEAIQDTVVLAKDKAGDTYLVGYYVSEAEISSTELMHYLSQRIPEYMVPAHFVHLESFPLTTSGKVDRKELPDPVIAAGEDYVAPSNETEEALVSLWSKVLSIDPANISTTVSFFSLGGHSLKAATLVNKIAKQLRVEVPLKEVFRHQDIKNLSAFILSQHQSAYEGISPAVEQDYYPLSSSQRRMYFLQSYDPVSVVYNMPQVVKLAGALDRKHLEGVFSQLIGRHESLRTSFGVVEGEAVQVVHKQVDFALEYHQTEESAAPALIREFVRPFDLQQASQFRVGLVKLSEQAHLLLVDMHHIISDGVSQGQLIQDFMALYQGKALPGLDIQYKDYAVWQQSDEQQLRLKAQRQFWRDEFAHQVSVLDLPTDRSRPVALSHRGAYQSCLLDQEETNRLKALSQEAGATLYMTMLSVFNVLLSKLSRQEDITIGTPVAGRDHAEVEGVIGMFVNTVVLRNYPKGGMSFRQFLTEVKRKVLGCFAHQGYGYEELIEELGIPRDPSRNPLFDVMFSYEHQNKGELVLPGLRLQDYPSAHAVSKFDLTLTVSETEEGMYLNFEYAKDLFDQGTIVRFISYLQKIIAEVTADPQKLLVEIDILSEEERTQLLHEFNDTAAEYPKDKTLVELFEEQAQRTPDHAALVLEEQTMSYTALDARTNQLARHFVAQGCSQGSIVGLMVDRSMEMMVGMLAIMKAGAAYLPIGTDLPEPRVRHMLEDSGAKLLVTQKEYGDQYQGQIAVVDVYDEEVYSPDDSALNVPYSSSQLAYIIYTSGSTGNPKGVMVAHQSVVNMASSLLQRYGVDSKERILQFSSITFDASVEQIWLAWLSGSALVLISQDILMNEQEFNAYLSRHEVTHIDATPTFLESIRMIPCPTLRRVVSGGEECSQETISSLSSYCDFYNSYGPTEATVNNIVYKYDPTESLTSRIPIGRPIHNTKLYVVNKRGQLQAMGVPGELWIGGEGVTLGYLGNEELTGEKFILNPFQAGEKVYRTGDLVRWLPDGQMEFLGRIDDQVKIRGFRIELGEIERALSTHAGVQGAAVLVKEREGHKYLVGYYVARDALTTDTLKQHLLQILPEYMVPVHYVQLDRFPQTSSGKVNRKKLPNLGINQYSEEPEEAPRNAIELRLVEVWKQVLKLESLGVNSNFFRLGGNSLTAIALTNAINHKLGLTLPTRIVFEHQTIKEMCAEIQRMESDKGNFETGTIRKAVKPKTAHLSYTPDLPYLFFAAPLGGILPPTSMVGIVDMVEGLKDVVSFVSLQTPPLMPKLLDQIEQEDEVKLNSDLFTQSIRELAVEMVEDILKIQDTPSYCLGAFCAGTTLVLEIAKELIERGKQIDKLILIDPPTWVETIAGSNVDLNYTKSEVAEFVAYDLGWDTPEMDVEHLKERLVACSMDEVWGVCKNYMKRLNMFDRQFEESEVKKSFERKFYDGLVLNFYFASQPFRYPTVDVEDTLVLATKGAFSQLQEVAQSRFTGKIAIEPIEATHHDLFQPGFLKQWSNRMKDHLQDKVNRKAHNVGQEAPLEHLST